MSTKNKTTTARKKASKPRTVAKKAKKASVVEVVEEATEEATKDAAEKKIEQRLDDTIQELKDYKAMVRGMCNAFIESLQDAKREIRQLRRTQKKPRQTNSKAPKKQCTFEIPIALSDDLCDFLGVPPGTKMSRNMVTHNIQKYCVSNGLKNGRAINPDKKMMKILRGIPKDKNFELTWLNLQTYIKHHYS